jgi:hypothetical protein
MYDTRHTFFVWLMTVFGLPTHPDLEQSYYEPAVNVEDKRTRTKRNSNNTNPPNGASRCTLAAHRGKVVGKSFAHWFRTRSCGNCARMLPDYISPLRRLGRESWKYEHITHQSALKLCWFKHIWWSNESRWNNLSRCDPRLLSFDVCSNHLYVCTF